VFQQFRQTTPLAALHVARLEHIQADLCRTSSGLSTAEIARRYGFTNHARFAAAYRQRFGKSPAETSSVTYVAEAKSERYEP
jgi:transcriptional regulator GlxA family with amidase domain